jgi:hypothetical protein
MSHILEIEWANDLHVFRTAGSSHTIHLFDTISINTDGHITTSIVAMNISGLNDFLVDVELVGHTCYICPCHYVQMEFVFDMRAARVKLLVL